MENKWFKSYLNNRNQTCFVNGCLSQNRSLACLSYTQPRMYADDRNLSFPSDSIDTIEHKMNHDLANIKEWLIANKLTLNKSKTEFMLIGSRQKLRTFDKSPSLVIDGAPLNRVSNTKSLGVTIDENLSWSEHIGELCKKIASGIGAIKRTRSLFPRRTLQLVYNSLVQPYFDYCNSVWGNCCKTLATKLQKLQNRAARVLTFSGYDISADNLFKDLGWKNLECQHQIGVAVMVYNSLNGLAPDDLSSRLVDRSSITNYQLRNTEASLAIPLPRTNFMKNSFCYRGAVIWNSLPIGLRQGKTLGEFRSGCSSFLS